MTTAMPNGATRGPGLEEPAGKATVLRILPGAQLRHLAGAAQLPGVRLQVVPFAWGGHAAASGSFPILRFEEQDLPDVDYTEHPTGAVYLDQRADAGHYPGVVGQFSGEALTPASIIRIIEQAGRGT